MKRLVFSILMILALTAGAAFAQSPINTTAPGPTVEKEPGQTNNDLPNPGNPQTQVNTAPTQQQPVQEQGTVEGTATESLNNQQGANTTGNVTGTTNGTMDNTTGTTTGTMDTTTTGTTTGTMDNTTGTTTGTYGTTTGTTTGTTGTMDTTDTTTGTSNLNDTGTLPSTASHLPLVGLIGLLALAAAFVVRRF
jgi:hypothetical protein